MPRRSLSSSTSRRSTSGSRRKKTIEDDDDNGDNNEEEEEPAANDDDDDEMVDVVTNTTPNPSQLSLSQRHSTHSQQKQPPSQREWATNDSSAPPTTMLHQSQVLQNTQDIHPVRPSDRNNLNRLSETAREKAITDLTRLILFKSLAGESIDRAKCIKEAGIQEARISSAAFEEANRRLKNTFDFELRRMPAWMELIKNLPAKYKDRYYLINYIPDDAAGKHNKALHSVHEDSAMEKAFLMVVLGLIYCGGVPRSDGSRWILDQHLYEHLNRIDENFPKTPPSEGGGRKRAPRASSTSSRVVTPDVDALLVKFVQRDYLLEEKASDRSGSQAVEDNAYYYSLGPRAAMEIGRKQILYFCAEILDQDPDPTMLQELQQEEEMAATAVMEQG